MDVPLASRPADYAEPLAKTLGCFSVALGLMELIAPRTLARTLGMTGSEALIAGYGVREIATGIGILNSAHPAPWIWARVAGDALDIGTLAPGLSEKNPRKGNLALALAAVIGVTALDVLCGQALAAQRARAERRQAPNYSDRSGMPQRPEAMRGAARDYQTPRDMRIPEAMRPYSRS